MLNPPKILFSSLLICLFPSYRWRVPVQKDNRFGAAHWTRQRWLVRRTPVTTSAICIPTATTTIISRTTTTVATVRSSLTLFCPYLLRIAFFHRRIQHPRRSSSGRRRGRCICAGTIAVDGIAIVGILIDNFTVYTKGNSVARPRSEWKPSSNAIKVVAFASWTTLTSSMTIR